MLRLKYYRDRTPDGGPYPPEADFAADWNGYAEVNNMYVQSVCSGLSHLLTSVFI